MTALGAILAGEPGTARADWIEGFGQALGKATLAAANWWRGCKSSNKPLE